MPPGADDLPGGSWFDLATAPDDADRLVFSEYHAMRSPSGAFMIRRGRYKFHYYVGYEPELFDIAADPEETNDLAADPAFAEIRDDCLARLRSIVDPEAADASAKADQKALVERHGGPEAVMARAKGGKGFTEVPPEVLAIL
jgi:choline-sulfatase